MALTEAQEQREDEVRVEQMTLSIEELRDDIRYENRKSMVQIIALVVAAFAAGAAWVTYLG